MYGCGVHGHSPFSPDSAEILAFAIMLSEISEAGGIIQARGLDSQSAQTSARAGAQSVFFFSQLKSASGGGGVREIVLLW